MNYDDQIRMLEEEIAILKRSMTQEGRSTSQCIDVASLGLNDEEYADWANEGQRRYFRPPPTPRCLDQTKDWEGWRYEVSVGTSREGQIIWTRGGSPAAIWSYSSIQGAVDALMRFAVNDYGGELEGAQNQTVWPSLANNATSKSIDEGTCGHCKT